ncbi:hypothetical protein HK104_007186, partial [Borealophlyctis nickersoniae]
ASPASLRKIFTVQAFVVNRSSRTRRLTLVVPNKTKADGVSEWLSKSQKGGDGKIDVHMDDDEFLRRYEDVEKREASIVCLENNVELSPLPPNSCQAVNIHFIAVKGHMHRVERVQVYDRDSRHKMEVVNVLEVYVEDKGGS